MTPSRTRYVTIDEYIQQFPHNTQMTLSEVRNAIKAVAPTAEETICYGIPTFKLNCKNLVHFAAFKNHIGFYPTPEPIVAFQKDLTHYKHAKGSIWFPVDKPLPIDIITKIVQYRIDALTSDST